MWKDFWCEFEFEFEFGLVSSRLRCVLSMFCVLDEVALQSISCAGYVRSVSMCMKVSSKNSIGAQYAHLYVRSCSLILTT